MGLQGLRSPRSASARGARDAIYMMVPSSPGAHAMADPRCSILLLTWNGAPHLERLLPALAAGIERATRAVDWLLK